MFEKMTIGKKIAFGFGLVLVLIAQAEERDQLVDRVMGQRKAVGPVVRQQHMTWVTAKPARKAAKRELIAAVAEGKTALQIILLDDDDQISDF